VSLVVQKFGGTSVASAERIMAAARRAIRARQAGHQVIVVVSARGDTTDELIELAREITEYPPSREMDMLLSTGEQISTALMAMAVQALGQPAVSFTGQQVGIVTDSTHTKARIKNISTQRLRQGLDEGNILIVAGFQGIDEHYDITTLGRGGSDTTAVALAAALKHDPGRPMDGVDCEIYTDVDGVYTTDPRLVPEARKLACISYDEMLELASLGAGVMHSRSIEFAKKFGVPLQVRNSFSDVEGTWIIPETPAMQAAPVCGVALARDETRVSINGVPDRPGVSHRLFTAIADRNLVVDMIAQNIGMGGKADIGFTVLKNDLPATLAVIRPLAAELDAIVNYQEGLSKVSMVGVGMRTHTGVAERMFTALAADKVNIQMITTSEIKISALVDKQDGTRALKAVHHAFRLHEHRPVTNGSSKPGIANNAPEVRDIVQALASMEEILVSDVVLDADQGRITLFNLPDQPGVCARLFSAIARAGIVVDLIVQNLSGPGVAELSFSVPRNDLNRAAEVTRHLVAEIGSGVQVVADPDIAKVSVLGVGMRTHTGVARGMFGALAERGINIAMISTSEIRVSVVVDLKRGAEAVTALKETFHLK
jgi:aspartate kinase